MECEACGTNNPDSSRYCAMCGDSLPAASCPRPAAVVAAADTQADPVPRLPVQPLRIPDLPEEWLLDGVGVMPAAAQARRPPDEMRPAFARLGLANAGFSSAPAQSRPAHHVAAADEGGFTLLGLGDRDWPTPDYLLEGEDRHRGRMLVWTVMAFGLAAWLTSLWYRNPDWRTGAVEAWQIAQSQMSSSQQPSHALPVPSTSDSSQSAQPAAVPPAAPTQEASAAATQAPAPAVTTSAAGNPPPAPSAASATQSAAPTSATTPAQAPANLSTSPANSPSAATPDNRPARAAEVPGKAGRGQAFGLQPEPSDAQDRADDAPHRVARPRTAV